MKIFLGLILLCLSTFLGYSLSSKYSKRFEFYKEFFKFNNKMINEVSFSQKSIVDILNEDSINGDFSLSINEYLTNNEIRKENFFLEKDEKDFLFSYFSNLGNKDKDTELNFLKSVNGEIENKLSNAKNDEKKYKKLYVKIGFCIGMILLIIVI